MLALDFIRVPFMRRRRNLKYYVAQMAWGGGVNALRFFELIHEHFP